MGQSLRMRILFITPYVPSVIRVRPFQLVRALVRRGHDVVLATLYASEYECRGLRDLKDEGVQIVAHPMPLHHSLLNCAKALFGTGPLQSVYSWNPALVDELEGLLSRRTFDIVHVEHLRGARYGMELARRLTARDGMDEHRPQFVWDSVDCISSLFRQARRQSSSVKARIMTAFEVGRTECFERQAMMSFNRVLITSPVDAAALTLVAGARGGRVPENLSVVANGVDLDYFCPDSTPRDPATIVVTGKMSYHANGTAVRYLMEKIMPTVWEARSDVKVEIVGKDPSREIRNYMKRYVVNGVDRSSQISVSGTVPDIRPYLRRATVSVAPVAYGAGIQNKVLEAMACATAVVATPQAVSAIQAVAGRDVLVADEPASFARHILSLLADPSHRRDIGFSGRRYVEANHLWSTIAGALEEVYLAAFEPSMAQ